MNQLPHFTLEDLPRTLRVRTIIDPDSRCWRAALGFHDKDGYAQFRGRMAHREVWRLLVGPVLPSEQVDHVRARGCVWRDCIWPRHLEPVPVAVNIMRSDSASARNARKTHCGTCGREFDLLNTAWSGNRRRCRACGGKPARAALLMAA